MMSELRNVDHCVYHVAPTLMPHFVAFWLLLLSLSWEVVLVLGDSTRIGRCGSTLSVSRRNFGLLSLHQPSLCFELVHWDEIVGPLV